MRRRDEADLVIWSCVASAGSGLVAVAVEGPLKVGMLSVGSAMLVLAAWRLWKLRQSLVQDDITQSLAWNRDRAYEGLLRCLTDAISDYAEIRKRTEGHGLDAAISGREAAVLWRESLVQLFRRAVLSNPGWERIHEVDLPVPQNLQDGRLSYPWQHYKEVVVGERAKLVEAGSKVIREGFQPMPWLEWKDLVAKIRSSAAGVPSACSPSSPRPGV